MVKAFIFILSFVFLCHSFALAFQYGDYAWGSSWDQVKTQLKDKNRTIVTSKTEHTIAYEDTLFGSWCEVSLFFTEKSEVLFMVKLFWKDTSSAEVIFDALVKNHGEPLQPDPDIDRFAWVDEESEDSIAFDCSGGVTELYYSAGDIYKGVKSDGKQKAGRF